MRSLTVLFLALAAPLQAQSASFEKGQVPGRPDDGGYRYFSVAVQDRLNLRDAARPDAAVVARLSPGTVLDNLGCLAGADRAWCYVQPLGGGPVGYVAAEYLAPAISPAGAALTGPNDSALRAGRGDFDATGFLACTIGRAAPMQCPFGVSRAGGGDATIVVDRPQDGGKRVIFFSMGTAIGASTSEAMPGDFSARRDGDVTLIRIDRETYTVPDAAPFGG